MVTDEHKEVKTAQAHGRPPVHGLTSIHGAIAAAQAAAAAAVQGGAQIRISPAGSPAVSPTVVGAPSVGVPPLSSPKARSTRSGSTSSRGRSKSTHDLQAAEAAAAQAEQKSPRKEAKYTPKNIFIPGAGIGGVCSALELAEKHYPDGTLKYNITIVERNPEILRGASDATPGRMGLGFHYVDVPTAIQYLGATIKFQKDYSTERTGRDFRIGADEKDEKIKHTLQHGRYFITKDSKPGKEEILKTYREIQKEYARLVALDPADKVFGEPKDFFRVLDPSEYNEDVNMDKVDIGIETAECLLNWPEFRKYLMSQLKAHENIKIMTSTTVSKLTVHPETLNYTVETVEDTGVREVSIQHTADSIANCTWQNTRALTSTVLGDKFYPNSKQEADAQVKAKTLKLRKKHAGKTKEEAAKLEEKAATPQEHLIEIAGKTPGVRTNRLKAIIFVELPKELRNAPSAFFCMGPHVMFSNLGSGRGAMTFAPVTSMFNSTDLDVPDEVNKYLNGQATAEEKLEIGNRILRGVPVVLSVLDNINKYLNPKTSAGEKKSIEEQILQDLKATKSAQLEANFLGLREEEKEAFLKKIDALDKQSFKDFKVNDIDASELFGLLENINGQISSQQKNVLLQAVFQGLRINTLNEEAREKVLAPAGEYLNANLSSNERFRLGREILEAIPAGQMKRKGGVVTYLPKMGKAVIKEIKFGIVQTLGEVEIFNHLSEFNKRDYNGISQELVGLISNACMKLLYGPENGEMVGDLVERHMKELEAIKVFYASLEASTKSAADAQALLPEIKSLLGAAEPSSKEALALKTKLKELTLEAQKSLVITQEELYTALPTKKFKPNPPQEEVKSQEPKAQDIKPTEVKPDVVFMRAALEHIVAKDKIRKFGAKNLKKITPETGRHSEFTEKMGRVLPDNHRESSRQQQQKSNFVFSKVDKPAPLADAVNLGVAMGVDPDDLDGSASLPLVRCLT